MNFFTKRSGHHKYDLYKLLLVMRLTLILLVAGMLSASAAIYGQQVTLNQNNITIKDLFKVIKFQTGYDVLWQPEKLDASRKISVRFNRASLDHVMRECLNGQGLIYEIQDQSIVLKSVTESRRASSLVLQQDSVIYRGRITNETGKGMAGATIRVVGGTKTTKTNFQGNFAIYGPIKGELEFSYVGYLSKQLTLNGLDPSQQISITLIPGVNTLGEVNVVSTGYQEIAKERATGSFEVITKEQLQQSSDPNLIRRLEGITTSMNFNNQLIPNNSASVVGLAKMMAVSPISNLTIRGRNTLVPTSTPDNTTGQVLVIIDGIASPYSIDKVDPNDVESITVLKDAAASSIWGSRAANGVIVVKTKRGAYNQPLQISFNSNFNVTKKLNLFYKNYMSTSEYIDAQIFQFNASNTTINSATSLTSPQPFNSPVAEILGQQKRGEITAAQANDQLNALRGNDIRKDYDKYLLRDALTQSYSVAINAGSKNIAYRLSAAYNKSLNNTVASDGDRLSINYNTSLHLLKNLDFQVGVTYSQQKSNNQNQNNPVIASIGAPYYLYTRLADDQGNTLNIPYKYRPDFVNLIANAYGDKVLDLHYNPLQNINDGYVKTNEKNLNLNFGANYKLSGVFSINLVYNYSRGQSEQDNLSRETSFFVRDLVTSYTTPSNYSDPVLGSQPFFRQIPLGGFYQPTLTQGINQTLRGQLNVNKNWSDKHALNIIAGMDVNQNYFITKSDQYYGYNESTGQSVAGLNYYNFLRPLFNVSGSSFVKIPYQSLYGDYKIRTYSLFTNGAYTYNKLYTISASVRKDVSSQFGPETNRGGTPYYSIGGKWNISGEKFYQISFLPSLQLRTTFGYNGNVNPSITSRPLLSASNGTAITGLQSVAITSTNVATNNQLRPEKTAIMNLGLDFGFRNNRLSGSLEYYNKRTTDLLAGNPVDPSTGYNQLVLNLATLRGWGTDLTLNSQNLRSGLFSWTSNFLFSYNRVKVVKLYASASNTVGQAVLGSPTYNEGYDLSRLFAFRWGGLDPATGDPRSYVNGQPITITSTASYNSVSGSPISNARYFGSAVPVYYGSIRNTFNYGAFSVSVNLLYKLGYYFRRPFSETVSYNSFFTANTIQGSEYSRRWQKPGDELITNVPSLTYPGSQQRDLIYQYSEINVLKADHVRLQQVNLSYLLNKKNWFLKNPRVYTNISNLGVIWRANKLGLDPDINDYPMPMTYAFGFSANF